MPYLNLDLDYFSHPKVIRLTGLLGSDAALLPIRLWVHAGKHHSEQGVLEAYSKHELEAVVAWVGEKGVCVDAFLKVGLIEEVEGGFKIHDWKDHAGHLSAFKKRAKSAAKKRWKKYAASITRTKTTNTPNLSSPLLTKEQKSKSRAPRLTDEEWMERLKNAPAYSHVDFTAELSKMDMWLFDHPGRKKTRKFILNWINKIDKPIATQPQHRQPSGHMKVVL